MEVIDTTGELYAVILSLHSVKSSSCSKVKGVGTTASISHENSNSRPAVHENVEHRGEKSYDVDGTPWGGF